MGRAKVIAAPLWAVAIAVTVLLAVRRYRVGNVSGTDFRLWLAAARVVAAGHNPYTAGRFGSFVYPPTLALILSPFTRADPLHLWKIWTALEIAALSVGVVAFVSEPNVHLRSWRRPALFGFCSITVLHFWPVTVGLSYGQSDAFVFAALVLAGLAATRERPKIRGALIGVAGLVKGWPAAIGSVLLQRGLERRRESIVALGVVVLVAPISIVAVGGISALTAFVTSNVDARSQHLVSASVWGAPKLLFSRSGFARPLLVSSSLRVLLTAILLVWVAGLLVTALRTSGDPALCTWNVTLCVVLLLPVSHLAYTLYGVPILWAWAARAFARAPRWVGREVVVVAVLLVWWVVQCRRLTNQDLGPEPTTISSARYCVVFAANLVACTFSVVGATGDRAMLITRGGQTARR